MTLGEIVYEAFYGYDDWYCLPMVEQERWNGVGNAVAEEVGKQLVRSLIV